MQTSDGASTAQAGHRRQQDKERVAGAGARCCSADKKTRKTIYMILSGQGTRAGNEPSRCFHNNGEGPFQRLSHLLNILLNVKPVVSFNKEKVLVLVRAFSVIGKTSRTFVSSSINTGDITRCDGRHNPPAA